MTDPAPHDDAESSERPPLAGVRRRRLQSSVPSDVLPEGVAVPDRAFRITLLHRDDGPTDIGINHDRYFADEGLAADHGPETDVAPEPDATP